MDGVSVGISVFDGISGGVLVKDDKMAFVPLAIGTRYGVSGG